MIIIIIVVVVVVIIIIIIIIIIIVIIIIIIRSNYGYKPLGKGGTHRTKHRLSNMRTKEMF